MHFGIDTDPTTTIARLETPAENFQNLGQRVCVIFSGTLTCTVLPNFTGTSAAQNPPLFSAIFDPLELRVQHAPGNVFKNNDYIEVSGSAVVLDADCNYNVPNNSQRPSYDALGFVWVVDGLTGDPLSVEDGFESDVFRRAVPVGGNGD